MSAVDIHAEIESRLATLSASAKAEIGATTGSEAGDARVANGASAALSLAQGGFNPNSTDDQGKLIAAIAGGLTLIPGVGLLLGGAVEALYQVGEAVACPVTNAFASVGLGTPCGAPPCRISGPPFTPTMVMQASKIPPNKGAFQSMALWALCTFAAKELNCEGGFPPEDIVDAVVSMWNRTHAGPAVDFFVPPLQFGESIIPMAQNIERNGKVILDPNVSFAFERMTSVQADPSYHSHPESQWGLFPPFDIAEPTGTLGKSLNPPTTPRTVKVNTGATIKPVVTIHVGKPAAPAAAPSKVPAVVSSVAAPVSTSRRGLLIVGGMGLAALAAAGVYAATRL